MNAQETRELSVLLDEIKRLNGEVIRLQSIVDTHELCEKHIDNARFLLEKHGYTVNQYGIVTVMP